MTDTRPPPSPTQTPVLVYGSNQFDLRSGTTGRTYRIFVFKPPLPPPPSGYPAVMLTDANMSFPIAATVAATFAFAGKAALAIGVGYPTDDVMELVRLRNRDLTPPTPLHAIKQNPGRPPPNIEDYGGSEAFYRFLIEELRPAISAAYPVSAEDQTLYGHSLGGLFTLGVLLNYPQSFRNFVASSPSIFWNERSALRDEAGFVRKVQSKEAAPRALILVGADEQDVPETLLPGTTREQMKRMLRDWRMVDNARELAGRLAAIKGGPGYAIGFHALKQEDHLTALPASISRAFSFALRTPPPRRSWLAGLRRRRPSQEAELDAPLVECGPQDDRRGLEHHGRLADGATGAQAGSEGERRRALRHGGARRGVASDQERPGRRRQGVLGNGDHPADGSDPQVRRRRERRRNFGQGEGRCVRRLPVLRRTSLSRPPPP